MATPENYRADRFVEDGLQNITVGMIADPN